MQAQILQILQVQDYQQEIARGAEVLSAGKLVVLPTETSYAVAALVSHAEARSALRDLRPSPRSKPLTLHVARPSDALAYLGELNDFARRVIKKLWPGPIGLIFEVPPLRRKEVADRLGVAEAELYDGPNITLRCPDHPVFFDVASKLNGPLALTAPPGGAAKVTDLDGQILDRVEMILDAGETRFSKPSTLVKVQKNSYDMVRPGVYDRRIIDRLLKTTILFVCSGNTCRSPMAEAIAKRYLAEKLQVGGEELEQKGIYVTSAGASALPGARATPQAAEAVRDMGLDLSHHRSRSLTVELIHQADVVYTMGRGHAQAVAALVPAAADKVVPLDPEHDIEDPIGGDPALYVNIANQLKTLIEQRLKETTP